MDDISSSTIPLASSATSGAAPSTSANAGTITKAKSFEDIYDYIADRDDVMTAMQLVAIVC